MDYTEYKGFLDPAADRSVLFDNSNRLRTRSLFVETIDWSQEKKGVEPLYSLTEYEREGKPSAYQIFIHCVSEYEAAMKLVGSLRHWRKLLALKWFVEGVEGIAMSEGLGVWRKDMAHRDASIAKGVLFKGAGKNDTSSARKLLDMAGEVIEPAPKRGPGRPPTKADKAAKDTEKQEANELEQLQALDNGDD
jgi:hypothetical protein